MLSEKNSLFWFCKNLLWNNLYKLNFLLISTIILIIWIICFRIVIDTLKNVEPKRKCYRMIGGVLCERTVEDIMPALVTNKEQV